MKTQMVCEKFNRDLNPSHHVSALRIHPSSFISRDSCHNIDEDIHACFQRLKQLVPTARLNSRLSKVQLLQQVIDYILDLESTLDTKPVEVEKSCDRLEDEVLIEKDRTSDDGESEISRTDSSFCSRPPLVERAFSINTPTTSLSSQQTRDKKNTNS